MYPVWVLSFCHLVRALFRLVFFNRFRMILEIQWLDIHTLFRCYFWSSTYSLVFVHRVLSFHNSRSLGLEGFSYLEGLSINFWLWWKIELMSYTGMAQSWCHILIWIWLLLTSVELTGSQPMRVLRPVVFSVLSFLVMSSTVKYRLPWGEMECIWWNSYCLCNPKGLPSRLMLYFFMSMVTTDVFPCS